MSPNDETRLPLDQFGEALQAARREHGHTSGTLGEIFGVTHQCVWQWETGAATPKRDTLRRLCKLLSLPYRCMAEKAAERMRVRKLNYYLSKEGK